MSLRLHLPNEGWKAVGYPSQEEKSSFRAVPFEEIQNFASILNHPRGPILPRASRNLLSECFYLEVILDINTQYMFYRHAFSWRACGMRTVQRASGRRKSKGLFESRAGVKTLKANCPQVFEIGIAGSANHLPSTGAVSLLRPTSAFENPVALSTLRRGRKESR